MQDEGGASWGVSQGEIEDLLASDKPLPSNIQSVIDDRQVPPDFLMPKGGSLIHVTKTPSP